MPEPTTSGGGSSLPEREREHRERAGEIGIERGESTLAATNRTAAEVAALGAAAAGTTSGWERTEDAILWRELQAIEHEMGRRRLGWPEGRPPEQLLEFVAWKLRIARDSFYGRLLHLVPHADRANLHALRQAFPALVDAWLAWQSADGDFELPSTSRRFVERGDVR